MSKLASANGIDSARPDTTLTSGSVDRKADNIGASGSMPTTSAEVAASEAVSFPVPQPKIGDAHPVGDVERFDRRDRVVGTTTLVDVGRREPLRCGRVHPLTDQVARRRVEPDPIDLLPLDAVAQTEVLEMGERLPRARAVLRRTSGRGRRALARCRAHGRNRFGRRSRGIVAAATRGGSRSSVRARPLRRRAGRDRAGRERARASPLSPASRGTVRAGRACPGTSRCAA